MNIYQGGIISNFLAQTAQFKIPVYQRNYKWSKEECRKLFNDIVAAAERNKLHFCGSFVFQPMPPHKGLNVNIIIDGQQRLTTIYILLKALTDRAKTDAEKSLASNFLFNKDEFHQLQLDETTKMKLKPAKDNDEQLINLIYDNVDNIDCNCDIYQNYKFFCELIEETQSRGASVADIYRGITMLTVAVIQLDSNDNAQEIFENINSTGVLLRLEDKIRNFVLMTEVDQDRLYEEYWIKIEQLLPSELLTSFFLDYLNMKVDGFAREKEAYDAFKELFINEGFTNETMLKEILHYSELYKAFLFGSPKYSDIVNSALLDLQRLKQTTVFLFLFKVFDDFEKGIFDMTELERIMVFLLNYSVRRLVCEVGSNSLRGLYKTLYSRVFANNENKNNYYDSIVSFFMQLTSKDALIDDDTFKKGLINNNLYRKNALCKYLLVGIENREKEQVLTTNLTIEHIMPQNPNLSTSWQNMLGEDWRRVHEVYLHTLGNLTLTAYNGELGDKPFKEKKEELAKKASKIVALNSDVVTIETWNEKSIINRAQRLSDLIVNYYQIELPQEIVSFKDPRYQEYSCDNPDDATWKTPNYYVLQGERVIVNNFAEMLRSVIERLYDQNNSIIDDLALHDAQVLSWSQNVMFSYSASKTTGDYRIKETNIFESVGFSATHIMYIIQALLDLYEIDHTDFVYSARSNKKDS